MRLSRILLALGVLFSMTVFAAAAEPEKHKAEGHVKAKHIADPKKTGDQSTLTVTVHHKGKDDEKGKMVDIVFSVNSKTLFVHKGNKTLPMGLANMHIHGGKEPTRVHVIYHNPVKKTDHPIAIEVKVQGD